MVQVIIVHIELKEIFFTDVQNDIQISNLKTSTITDYVLYNDNILLSAHYKLIKNKIELVLG